MISGGLMPIDVPPASMRLGHQPVYGMLVQFPVACFVGAFLTDLAYWRTELFV